MIIDKDTIQISIDNINWLSLGQYLLKAKYGHHKLWGDDTGRTQSGKFSGTFKGNYPKITAQFKRLNQNGLDIIAPYISQPFLYVKYYNPEKHINTTMQVNTGDWESEIERMGYASGISIALISSERA